MSNLQRIEKELDFLSELNAMIKIRLASCTEELSNMLERRKKMSNEINSTVMDNMRDNVHELWVIDGRPDLEYDCLQYCYDNIDRPVPITMIEFLSKHCYQALSSKDYEHMARENEK